MSDVKDRIDTRDIRDDEWNLRRRPGEPITTEPTEAFEVRYAWVGLTADTAPHDALTAAAEDELQAALERDSESAADRLIRKYIKRAMLRVVTKRYEEDGSWFAEPLSVPDVWGDGAIEAEALADLEAVLRHWIEVKITEHDGDIPVLDGIDLNMLRL